MATLDQLYVDRDIKVEGLVDGRDVAADGQTLDDHVADFNNPHNVTKAQVNLSNVENILNNYSANSDPTANDDGVDTSGNGIYSVGSRWINNTSNALFSCVDNATAAAVWQNMSSVNEEYTRVSIGIADSPYLIPSSIDYVEVDSSGGAVTVRLPSIAGTKKRVTVVDSSGDASENFITIVTSAADTINLDTDAQIQMNNNSLSLFSNEGTNWIVY